MLHRFVLYSMLFLALGSVGCTHRQLRYNHVHQAKTLTSIYEQQVLDNLAMFCQDEDALPFFAVPAAGSADVTDSGQLSVAPLFGPGRTVFGLPSLSRNNQLGWTITPISDPDRLKLMRCAFRRAIGANCQSNCCIDCCKEEKAWTGEETCCNCCTVRKLKLESCGKQMGHSPCSKVGSYCGKSIRVCPESYEDFTHLVLTILDYAVGDAYSPPTSEVTHYHYLTDKKGAYIVDGSGNFVIEYVDKFDAKATEFKSTEKDADGNAAKTTITPIPSSGKRPKIEILDQGNLLNEAIRTRARETLFPR